MREIKNESNERLGPHENGKEGTEKPLFNDAEQYTNTRSYIATKIRPKNIPVERFTNWLDISYFKFFASKILSYFLNLNYNFSFYSNIAYGIQKMLVYFQMLV